MIAMARTNPFSSFARAATPSPTGKPSTSPIGNEPSGQPATAGLPGHDADPGSQPASRPAGQRHHRPGQDRQRQDGGLCAGFAGQPECAAFCGAGDGVVPDARAGRAGGRCAQHATPIFRNGRGRLHGSFALRFRLQQNNSTD